ncbi:MAG: hypothetical protein JWN86_1962 [Planctomycetota bacterium]|nr:hypothetical protein [Planctomycetota bacterium]
MHGKQIEQRVLVITDGERIEGTLFHMGGIRLSDFLSAAAHQDDPYLKIKDPTVTCRRTGTELGRSPFLVVAKDRVVLIMASEAIEEVAKVPVEARQPRW